MDISASLIIGERIVVKKRMIKKTKYNPNTGKPYQIEEPEFYWVFKSDNSIITEIEEISVHDMYFEMDEGNEGVFGIHIIETPSHRHSEPIEKIDLDLAIRKQAEYKSLTGRNSDMLIMANC